MDGHSLCSLNPFPLKFILIKHNGTPRGLGVTEKALGSNRNSEGGRWKGTKDYTHGNFLVTRICRSCCNGYINVCIYQNSSKYSHKIKFYVKYTSIMILKIALGTYPQQIQNTKYFTTHSWATGWIICTVHNGGLATIKKEWELHELIEIWSAFSSDIVKIWRVYSVCYLLCKK